MSGTMIEPFTPVEPRRIIRPVRDAMARMRLFKISPFLYPGFSIAQRPSRSPRQRYQISQVKSSPHAECSHLFIIATHATFARQAPHRRRISTVRADHGLRQSRFRTHAPCRLRQRRFMASSMPTYNRRGRIGSRRESGSQGRVWSPDIARRGTENARKRIPERECHRRSRALAHHEVPSRRRPLGLAAAGLPAAWLRWRADP